ncbi:MAG: hypothetical protein SFU25_01025 [Candidatus Caenarcaniphilales bacterium]|nr:hypothetical protein [Candidatus Caenarcaniphilales bacterium]
MKKNHLSIIFTLLFSLSMGFAVSSCQKKVVAPTNEEIIKRKYQEFLKNRWIELAVHDEKILEKCISLEAEEGCTLEQIQYQEKEADVLKDRKMLNWSSVTQRYKVTQLGKDVYECGQHLKVEEMKKDENLRSKRVLK